MKNKFLIFCIVGLFLVACKSPSDQPDRIKSLPFRDGITRISDDSLAFVLFAPNKESVHLIGDFNDWEISEDYLMKKEDDRFWIKIGNLDKDKEYICQYLINNTMRIADPYANKISDPSNDKNIPSSVYPNLIAYPTGKTTQIAMTVSTKKDDYPWRNQNFTVPDTKNLVIYELLIRDFTAHGSINGVRERLPYLKELGVNAIELMPFNEFEGNDSWGYNPSFYFAPDKAYGTANDYKVFIDECHDNGMAVIMDMVLNHSYGQSPMVRMYYNNGSVTAENPWYNVKSNFANPDAQWGFDFNHESPYTQAFVDSVCSYWMKEYKIDGFRFDFTKGFSNTPYPATGDNWGSSYDADRIKNLKRIYDELKKRNPGAIFICEHLSENREEKELADYGMLLWGNLNYNMNEATMGWGEEKGDYGNKGDLSWASYQQREWTRPNLVVYMESHDEERLMYKNIQWGKNQGTYDVRQIPVGLQRNAAAAVILFSLPGPKMIWQFGELGYDISIDYNGRLGKKPQRWNYYDAPDRKALFDVYAKMIDLRKNHTVFSTSNYTIDLTKHFKTIVLKSTNETVAAMANFDVVAQSKNVNFTKTGVWKDYFTGLEISVETDIKSITLTPGEYRLYFCQ